MKNSNETNNPPAPFAGMDMIMHRKSVRNYTGQKVSREQLEALVKSGMAAPSAGNKQPWAFIAIDDRNTLDQLAEKLPYAKFLKNASAAIAVCGDLQKAFEGEEEPYWIQDCSAASQNILLASEIMGLGAVWTGVYPLRERINSVKSILDLPQWIMPLNVIPIGLPSGDPKPKDKWQTENLHWQKW